MRVFLIGEGELVELLIEELYKNNTNFLLVSSEDYSYLAENFEQVKNYSNITQDFLEEKDIQSFDKCIIILPEKNIIDTIVVSSLIAQKGVDTTVILPSKRYESIFNKLGVNYIISTYDITFKIIGEILLKLGPVENVSPFIEDYFIAKINILPNSPIANKKVKELDLRSKFNINIILAFRKELIQLEKGVTKTLLQKVNITPDTLLQPDMSIIIVGPFDSVKKFISELY